MLIQKPDLARVLLLSFAFVCFPTLLISQANPPAQAEQPGQAGQAAPQDTNTIVGCLNPGRSGLFSLREEGTGFVITVTGHPDLQRYSTNNEVRLTGRMTVQDGNDVFQVATVERLAETCQASVPFALSQEGFNRAIGRATYGVRGGIGFDRELIYIGGQAQLGPVFRNLWFRPNYEFGFGEVTKVNSFNFEFAYFLPMTARGSGSDTVEDFWTIFFGAGPALHLAHENFERGDVDIDFGDWDFDAGLNFFMGLAKRQGFFTELKAGAYNDATHVKILVGYSFH
jgi:hypothetical protein